MRASASTVREGEIGSLCCSETLCVRLLVQGLVRGLGLVLGLVRGLGLVLGLVLVLVLALALMLGLGWTRTKTTNGSVPIFLLNFCCKSRYGLRL